MASCARALACVLGLFLLAAGDTFATPSKPVKYRESYLVRFQKATCEGPRGKLVLLGPNDPIVLTPTGNLQVVTSAVNISSGTKRPEQMWSQILKEEPSTYVIQQSDESICMTVDADAGQGSILPTDICQTFTSFPFTPSTQLFNYQLVRNDLPGCKKSNRNGWAVIIRPRAVVDVGSDDICLSGAKTPGVRATLENCNKRNESQLWFINVPSIRRRLHNVSCEI